jgi:formamidopyrimidine-DNA glycosylase
MAETVVGRSVETVDVLGWPPIDASQPLNTRLTGMTIKAVWRRGKLLVLDLAGDMHLLLHPMMTGQLVLVEHGVTVFAGGHPTREMLGTMPSETTRLVVSLTGDTVLFFNDQRKFGWIRLLDAAALRADPFLGRIGREPLTRAFTLAGFSERLAIHRHAPI